MKDLFRHGVHFVFRLAHSRWEGIWKPTVSFVDIVSEDDASREPIGLGFCERLIGEDAEAELSRLSSDLSTLLQDEPI